MGRSILVIMLKYILQSQGQIIHAHNIQIGKMDQFLIGLVKSLKIVWQIEYQILVILFRIKLKIEWIDWISKKWVNIKTQ